ncbi:MAG: hypothetical protein ABL951_02700 [Alphaproteobacteria bacterium]
MTEIKNAIIKSAEICIEDHGLLTVWLMLDYGDSSAQGFGGYCLFNPNFPDKDRAGRFIRRVLDIAGVRSWDKLPGKTIRAKASGVSVESIGHILKDDWFTPSTDLVAP